MITIIWYVIIGRYVILTIMSSSVIVTFVSPMIRFCVTEQ